MSNRNQGSAAFFISIYYQEYGPFNLDELAARAAKREFGWDMYAYRFPKDNVWRHVRDIPELREILLKNFPLKHGDEGPAGGFVFKDKNSKLIEASPADAGLCSWENAENVCRNFSFNGYKDWRIPTKDELLRFSGYLSSQLSQKKNTDKVNELIHHWSSEHKGKNATAIITSTGREKLLPITEWHPVRPVRDLN